MSLQDVFGQSRILKRDFEKFSESALVRKMRQEFLGKASLFCDSVLVVPGGFVSRCGMWDVTVLQSSPNSERPFEFQTGVESKTTTPA